jgi:site-specific DNA-methyltransferase (adenine-specific)
MDYNNKIICGDSIEIMGKIPNNYIDLTLTSPPYDNLRTYKGYTFNFKGIAKELYRVTKEGGLVVWIVGDQTIKSNETGTSFKQALYFKQIGFNLHDTMIYVKDPKYPRKNGYGNSFDYMFILTKETIKTFNLIKRKNLCLGFNKLVTDRQKNGELIARRYTSPNESPLYNVWYYSSGYMKTTKDKPAYEHPAIFPERLAQDHILSWSNKGDIVLDPMCGSGTTCKMAKKLGRKYIGIDISEEYCSLSRRRVNATPEPLF